MAFESTIYFNFTLFCKKLNELAMKYGYSHMFGCKIRLASPP